MGAKPAGNLEELSTDQCYELLATQELGRLGVIIDHYPEILPVNYRLDHHVIVFRSDVGTKLTAADHANVTFQVDAVDPVRRSGWSVLVRGTAEIVLEGSEHWERTVAASTVPWVEGDKAHYVRVIPVALSGRRLVGDEGGWTDPRGYL
ncbi:MAG: pyridoxamine 5'-phosphate oxidase family protein [Acidimicrobiales bacterium]